MPPKSRNSIEEKGRILLAISALKKSQIPIVEQAVRHFQVPSEHASMALLQTEKHANSHKLTENEEESLLQ